jgi:hypothetical protein
MTGELRLDEGFTGELRLDEGLTGDARWVGGGETTIAEDLRAFLLSLLTLFWA